MDSVKTTAQRWMDRLESFRCRQCQRLLFKVTTQDLMKPGEVLEIKCSSCKTKNYLMGVEA